MIGQSFASGRDGKGRFTYTPPTEQQLRDTRAIYGAHLSAVCRHKGLSIEDVTAQLTRAGEPQRDRAWRQASYARQLAIYLTNTSNNVPQYLIAAATGLSKVAVCFALRAVEDLRDHSDYDQLIENITLEAKAFSAAAFTIGARP